MPARLEIVKDVESQRVYFYPQEGRPSSTPSVAIKNRFGTTVTSAATTDVTLDPVDTTVSVAGERNDLSLTLTSVDNIQVGQTYLAVNSLGQQEWLRVYSVNSATKVVELDEKLEYVHDTSTTFQATFFFRELQASEVNTLEQMYRARATYAVDGSNYTQEINFDVCLTPLVNPLTVEFVKKRRASIMPRESSQTRGSDYRDLRESAFDIVKKAIRKKGSGQKDAKNWRPALLRTPEQIDEWCLAELDVLLDRQGITILSNWDSQAATEHLEDRARELRNSSLNDLEWMDLTEDDSPSESEINPKIPHLMR